MLTTVIDIRKSNKFVILTAILLLMFFTSNSESISVKADVTTGLVGYWQLDEISGQVFDSINEIIGINYGSTTGVPGIKQFAYEFDGSDSFIDIGFPNEYMTPIGAVSAWIKSTEGGTVFSLRNKTSPYQYILSLGIHHDNRVTFYCLHEDIPQNFVRSITINLFDGYWHHVVWQSNGGTWISYVDGQNYIVNHVLAGENVGTWFGDFNSSNVDQFAIGIGYSDNFTGAIDDVRIYDRILSANEVLTLYETSIAETTYETLSTTTEIQDKTSESQFNISETQVIDQTNPITDESFIVLIGISSLVAIIFIGYWAKRKPIRKSTFKSDKSVSSVDSKASKIFVENNRFCSYCGNLSIKGDRFCSECGKDL
jgi:hypothetical protein